MFFRVLSAMVTADAIDRHARRRQHQQWYAGAAWAQPHQTATAPWREPCSRASIGASLARMGSSGARTPLVGKARSWLVANAVVQSDGAAASADRPAPSCLPLNSTPAWPIAARDEQESKLGDTLAATAFATWNDLSVAGREALFGGGGLFRVTGGALGGTAEFHWGGRRAVVVLPSYDHISDGPRWGREARKSSWREDDGKVVEIHTATVTTFEVRVEVPDGVPDNEAVKAAFLVAVQIAETLLATARTQGGQYWIPAAHEAPELSGYGSLVASGRSATRWTSRPAGTRRSRS